MTAKPKSTGNLPVPGPGRDSKYQVEFNDQARKLCLLGATDKEIADFFEVSVATISSWKHTYPAFLESMRDGKIKADANVADSLYRRATGEHVEIEQTVRVGDDFKQVKLIKYIPGDALAAHRWLLNRRRQDWSDTKVVELTGEVELKHRVQADADAFTRSILGLVARAGAGSSTGDTQH